MLLLNEEHFNNKSIDWNATIAVIGKAVQCLDEGDFVQPLKPYLRYGNLKNRIIAMPAFVGGDIRMAGIKWIASFPENISRGLPRAHSVVVLNHADTGVPLAIIPTALMSIIRTASVSGFVIERFQQIRKRSGLKIGVTGYGPIGQYHVKMCKSILGREIEEIRVYDIRRPDPSLREEDGLIHFVDCWQEAYIDADIFITCTVSDAPYIDRQPKAGSLHLNVSLRDYKTDVYEWFKDTMIVDNWEEVCRERTDIEQMHLGKGLVKEMTKSITDLAKGLCFETYAASAPVLFNPMGMAVFDIALAGHYYQDALYRETSKIL